MIRKQELIKPNSRDLFFREIIRERINRVETPFFSRESSSVAMQSSGL
eukprot:CAMPEP_0116085730 /NCGR_PEP_ID=MMETSP0327-20121206/4478_1 /TAXON_ID=44447 /ORGANISM="Pseudo-nitzschia delicatissima, Strain B596" /LENGTH=47 /DNA_ID= /DNA_START= /DNA_END= /DNA_ORIENTATION=